MPHRTAAPQLSETVHPTAGRKQKQMEPITFEPLLKRIRWGGRKLGSVLNKPIGDATDYAESWEIADHPDGCSIVAGGSYSGSTLNELISSQGNALLGQQEGQQQFPLLIKFLDANDWLSLQVHPNDKQAKQYNPDENGKTEAWIILDAEPESQICAGLKEGVTRQKFETHLRNGTVEETLHMIPAKVGDCIFVPAQTVHALGPGILLAEVQQQSNMTFRLHDWGRLGSDGKPREIHVEESLSCIDFDRGPINPVTPTAVSVGNNTTEVLISCDYFRIRRHTTAESLRLEPDNQFQIIMMLDGHASLQTEARTTNVTRGTTILLPAALESATMIPDGKATFLEITQP